MPKDKSKTWKEQLTPSLPDVSAIKENHEVVIMIQMDKGDRTNQTAYYPLTKAHALAFAKGVLNAIDDYDPFKMKNNFLED